ncbi:hypothetical protein BO78DRAFT_200296 [Aspergillus sclerotiicarbonarius CBS 121057]|uniref:Uncharacterized protein n=1 Tax=Aspergillus sclerotiicarbonarius (strain CBS 121057 / IBT 28362) TaxID=1448318 RepID=A0A319E9E6_ASPSB|nr:hypothetical protein BO78DRAFT_200296 [Aspergillus sclerotiicarbonarius CBS 121057]
MSSEGVWEIPHSPVDPDGPTMVGSVTKGSFRPSHQTGKKPNKTLYNELKWMAVHTVQCRWSIFEAIRGLRKAFCIGIFLMYRTFMKHDGRMPCTSLPGCCKCRTWSTGETALDGRLQMQLVIAPDSDRLTVTGPDWPVSEQASPRGVNDIYQAAVRHLFRVACAYSKRRSLQEFFRIVARLQDLFCFSGGDVGIGLHERGIRSPRDN